MLRILRSVVVANYVILIIVRIYNVFIRYFLLYLPATFQYKLLIVCLRFEEF